MAGFGVREDEEGGGTGYELAAASEPPVVRAACRWITKP